MNRSTMTRRTCLAQGAGLMLAASAAGCASPTPSDRPRKPVADMRSTDLPFGRIAWRRVGRSGPVLLAWPSLYADHRMYAALAEQMPDVQWLLVDAPGSGSSRIHAAQLSMSDSVMAARAVLDAESIERVTVVGTSWGGILGCELALAEQSRIAGIAAFNTPFDPQIPVSLRTRLILWMGGWAGDTAYFGQRVADSFFPAGFAHAHPDRLALFIEMFTHGHRHGMTTAARMVLADRMALSPRLGRIQAPVLVVAGDADALYPAESIRTQSSTLTRRTFHAIPNCGHLAPFEQPQVCATLLRPWLSTLA